MNVKELIAILKKIDEDGSGNASVTVCALDNDEDEEFLFKRVNGAELIDSGRKVFVAIYTQ